ncbi:uncharacterized protein LOC142493195 [Ascaphus truei]|uniref:uncharacterized protein LOC142493195 n=1 Tax=Ascaphus truei TaxID=8439 RepID=UPI003F596D5D
MALYPESSAVWMACSILITVYQGNCKVETSRRGREQFALIGWNHSRDAALPAKNKSEDRTRRHPPCSSPWCARSNRVYNMWKSKDISLATKCRLVSAIGFPIAMHDCETWTLGKAARRKIDAFELWCWRRLLRIPWTARITNQAVLERTKPIISLEAKITKQKLSYFGHIMQSKSFEKDVMLGMINGKRRRGRPRTRWLNTIKKDTGLNIAELKEAVRDRKTWSTLIHRVVESRTAIPRFKDTHFKYTRE